MKYYDCPEKDLWEGRIDSLNDYNSFRWHQIIRKWDINNNIEIDNNMKKFGIVGFRCDEGVKRNKGRTGASNGPDHIRKERANLPVNFDRKPRIYDCGHFYCKGQKLLKAQKEMSSGIAKILGNNFFPIILGGGH